MIDAEITVPDDVDRESYLRGYSEGLEAVRAAAGMLAVQAAANATDGDDGDGDTESHAADSGSVADLFGGAGAAESEAEECPACGEARLRAELGGRACPACGYRDGEPPAHHTDDTETDTHNP